MAERYYTAEEWEKVRAAHASRQPLASAGTPMPSYTHADGQPGSSAFFDFSGLNAAMRGEMPPAYVPIPATRSLARRGQINDPQLAGVAR